MRDLVPTRALTALLTVIGALVAAVPPVLAGATAATASDLPRDETGSIGIQLLEAPVDRRDDPRAHVYIVDHVNPGTTIERRVEVSNNTGERRRIDVYPAAASIEDDTFAFAPARTANELAEWISIEPERPVLDPNESIEATATIEVPENASEGERYAVLWAQSSAPPDDDGNIGSVRRVGVRVYLSVGPGGEPPSDFEITELTAERDEEGAPGITARVRNTGGRALDLHGELDLTDGPGGLSAGPYPVQTRTTVRPGETAEVDVALATELPDGPWIAELHLRSGRVERDVTAEVLFPEPGSIVGAELLSSWESPASWYVSAAVLLVIGATAVLVVWMRRRGQRTPVGADSGT